jgi:hypothetical protein
MFETFYRREDDSSNGMPSGGLYSRGQYRTALMRLFGRGVGDTLTTCEYDISRQSLLVYGLFWATLASPA